MYLYDEIAQFRDQTRRHLEGALDEDSFRPLRLQNGLYIQKHAPMLRVAIPYGLLSSTQLRKLAHIARVYDRGYGHFTTRQNLQYNWPALAAVPDILAELASVQMHAIQTSGNCVRNVTSDQLAGVSPDEVVDPLVWSELIRQWSTVHPEFAYLPRKFKIAVSGSEMDRAATLVHDIGIRASRDAQGEVGFCVLVGGGLGRTPMVGHAIREFLPWRHLLTYLDAILRVYNRFGRRDNKYKARIKITVHETGAEEITRMIEARFAELRPLFGGNDTKLLEEIRAAFAPPAFRNAPVDGYDAFYKADPVFRSWADTNLTAHRNAQYAIVTISLKAHGATPGDATSDQMRLMADLAERYGHSDLRISHEQNVILPHVHKSDLPSLHAALVQAGLGTANVGLLSDIIACPGMDYCALATARSIPVAQELATHFEALKLEHEIGPLKIKISGCINACGHHHVGHIGILGLDRAGVENYQITLGGDGTETAVIGDKTGPGFAYTEIVPAIERILRAYLGLRLEASETFLQAFRRVGMDPFKAALYEAEGEKDAA
jgi:sulfite reductase (NADPH) hemoprotein beta-component